MAVADAVLRHLVGRTKCKTLFITHYPLIATDLEREFPLDLQNLHMGYTSQNRIDGTREIAFLYQLTSGAATESFGIECARLAGVPEPILRMASERSDTMGMQVEQVQRRTKLVTQYLISSVTYTDLEHSAKKTILLLGQYLAGSRRPAEVLAELDVLVTSMSLADDCMRTD
jgi:DNA mismatch repair protein MSH3